MGEAGWYPGSNQMFRQVSAEIALLMQRVFSHSPTTALFP